MTPPYLWNALKRIKDRLRAPAPEPMPPPAPEAEPEPPQEWEYVPEGWARTADPAVKGWDVEAVAAAYRRRWPGFVRALEGPGPLGIAHEVPEGAEIPREEGRHHNTIVSFAYVLALAAQRKERVSLLDWGGGLGHYYVIAKAVLPGVEIDYSCRDLPNVVAVGRELLPDASFYDDDSCLSRRYDLVLASSSLQYSQDWSGMLTRLAEATDGYLYVTRLPIALHSASFVVLQRAYAYGYETEYLGWVINREDLLAAAALAGMELVREFVLIDLFSAPGAPEDPTGHRGFLFRPASPRD